MYTFLLCFRVSSLSALCQMSAWIRVCASTDFISIFISVFMILSHSWNEMILLPFVVALPRLFNRRHWNADLGLVCCVPVGNSLLRTDLQLESEPLEAHQFVSAACLWFNLIFLPFQIMVFLADCLCASKNTGQHSTLIQASTLCASSSAVG